MDYTEYSVYGLGQRRWWSERSMCEVCVVRLMFFCIFNDRSINRRLMENDAIGFWFSDSK